MFGPFLEISAYPSCLQLGNSKRNTWQLLCWPDRPFSHHRCVEMGTLLQAQRGQSTETQSSALRTEESGWLKSKNAALY